MNTSITQEQSKQESKYMYKTEKFVLFKMFVHVF